MGHRLQGDDVDLEADIAGVKAAAEDRAALSGRCGLVKIR
jgi:hypothetical protein